MALPPRGGTKEGETGFAIRWSLWERGVHTADGAAYTPDRLL
jgi:hypothetical protein